jgi:hypothetical protein
VLERRGGERGKGAALAWALERLDVTGSNHDAVLFLDADCVPSPNLLSEVQARMLAGAHVVQADYVVSNPEQSWSSALRYASFALVNTVRPRGKHQLGLSCGISGSGFAVSRQVLERVGWAANSLTEDTEYHLQLLASGVAVEFIGEAAVSSPMPTSLAASQAQNKRWEMGKLAMVTHWAPRLLAAGYRRRDVQLVHAAVEGLLLPQSVLAAATLTLGAGGAALRSRTLTRAAMVGLVGQALYVLGGLSLVRAPVVVYRALAFAPLLMCWKLLLYVRLLAGRGPRSWERTAR